MVIHKHPQYWQYLLALEPLAGSLLSIGSTGSILSIGSAGSILSIGGSILGIGRRDAYPGKQ